MDIIYLKKIFICSFFLLVSFGMYIRFLAFSHKILIFKLKNWLNGKILKIFIFIFILINFFCYFNKEISYINRSINIFKWINYIHWTKKLKRTINDFTQYPLYVIGISLSCFIFFKLEILVNKRVTYYMTYNTYLRITYNIRNALLYIYFVHGVHNENNLL